MVLDYEGMGEAYSIQLEKSILGDVAKVQQIVDAIHHSLTNGEVESHIASELINAIMKTIKHVLPILNKFSFYCPSIHGAGQFSKLNLQIQGTISTYDSGVYPESAELSRALATVSYPNSEIDIENYREKLNETLKQLIQHPLNCFYLRAPC